MTPDHRLPYSEIVRVNEIGAGLTRDLVPDDAARARIVKALNLASLASLEAEMTISPAHVGWKLSGRILAVAEQVCGITLESLPVRIDERFIIDLVEASRTADDEATEVEVTLEDDAPDVIEESRIDLGQYAVEQLALALDPFPRKPGAEFVQPAEPAEISPFAVLKQFRLPSEDGKS